MTADILRRAHLRETVSAFDEELRQGAAAFSTSTSSHRCEVPPTTWRGLCRIGSELPNTQENGNEHRRQRAGHGR